MEEGEEQGDENPENSKRSQFLFSDSHNAVNSHWFTFGPWEATHVLPRSTSSLDKRSCQAKARGHTERKWILRQMIIHWANMSVALDQD